MKPEYTSPEEWKLNSCMDTLSLMQVFLEASHGYVKHSDNSNSKRWLRPRSLVNLINDIKIPVFIPSIHVSYIKWYTETTTSVSTNARYLSW